MRLIWQARALIAPTDLDDTQHNARNLEIEIFWAAILAGAAAFNAPFALRLGASNNDIGLLSSIPSLIALIITMPAGAILARSARRMPWMIWSLFLTRIGYLFIALLPLLPGENKGTILVWLLIVFSAPGNVFNVAWNSMLAEVIPETDRARVFAMRNIIVAVGVTVTIFAAGRWLESAVFPFNYQVMYAIGLAGGMISIYCITRLRVHEPVAAAPVAATPRPAVRPRELLRAGREALTSQPDFFRLVTNTLAHSAGLWMIGPLYILYYVRTLGANEGWIGLNGTLGNLTPAIGYYLWQRAITRWGENRVLRVTISFIGLYPVLVGLIPNLTVIVALTALQGLLSPGTNLAHFNMLLKICPAQERHTYMALWTALMNLGAFIMPLIGVALANQFGFAPVLVAGGVMCLLGSSLFRWRSLQTPDSLEVRHRELSALEG